jgi:hypothetical protein
MIGNSNIFSFNVVMDLRFTLQRGKFFCSDEYLFAFKKRCLLRAAFTPQGDTWYSFLLEAVSTWRAIVRPELLSQWKV